MSDPANILTGIPDPAGSPRPQWQRLVRTAVRCPEELLRRVGLGGDRVIGSARAAAHGQFRTFAPTPWIERIRRGDPADPLLRQVLPTPDELSPAAGFTGDAVGDGPATRSPGLIHKYRGRALLVASGLCAVHCRYCFRRHYPYDEAPRSTAGFSPALETIRNDASLREIILSGGDPLMLGDRRLRQLVEAIAAIPHLERLRVHSRLPVVIPQRVTDGLLEMLRETRLATWMVVHCNHPREIDANVARALSKLVDAGIPVLNQAVLLSGVNDDADTLCELSERLVQLRCVPYYLHQLDRVAGAAHFEVPEVEGRALVAELRRRLPGFAVPRYVRETAGDAAKTVLL